MVRRALRSRSFRKVKKVSPSGKRVTHFVKKKPASAKCGTCGKPLSGVPRNLPVNIRKKAKTSRRPTRPYGGNLCPSCTRQVMKEMARMEQ